MTAARIVVSREHGKISVLAAGLDRFETLGLIGRLTEELQALVGPPPKDWQKDPAWARTSSRSAT